MNEEIEAKGATVLVIGPRGQSAAALIAREIEAPFPVLADPTRKSYRAYGFTKSLWVIQQSGVVVVDREGVVVYLDRNTNPQNSYAEEEILQELSKMG